METLKLQEWAGKNKPADDLIYKKGYWDQIVFIRDELRYLFYTKKGDSEFLQNNTTVVSTHMSKSVLLPVFKVVLTNGINLIMRYNFHNWKVSIISEFDVNCDFTKLFNYEDKVHGVYCEGFEDDWVYESYSQNKKNFTIELRSGYYYLFTFLWILKAGTSCANTGPKKE